MPILLPLVLSPELLVNSGQTRGGLQQRAEIINELRTVLCPQPETMIMKTELDAGNVAYANCTVGWNVSHKVSWSDIEPFQKDPRFARQELMLSKGRLTSHLRST